RSVTRAMEPVLGRAERHRAAEVRALPVRGDDPAGRMEQEEVTLTEQDRRVVRFSERREHGRLRPDVDRHAEPDDLADLHKRHDGRNDLGARERHGAEEAVAQQPAPVDAGSWANADHGLTSYVHVVGVRRGKSSYDAGCGSNSQSTAMSASRGRASRTSGGTTTSRTPVSDRNASASVDPGGPSPRFS